MTPFPSCIKHKIDWLTIMFENVTPWEVFQCIGINRLCNEEVYEAFNRRYFLQNYDSHVAIDFKFGVMHVRAVDVFQRCNAFSTADVNPNDFFFTEFPHIRFDLPGQKLDALREEGIDIDKLVFNPLELPNREACRYHYTRCDFAFDFLNYAPEFMPQLEQLIYEVGNPETCRVPTGVPGGLKYNVHKGANGFTIYLGAGKSTKLLRCYDKMFQYRNDLSSVPYYEDQGDSRQYPFSWMRMELQTRREQAEAVITQSGGDWMSIFKYIYDNFAIMQSQGSTQVSVLWQSLFNFQNIRSIIQNAKSVRRVSSYDRAETYVLNMAFRSIFIMLSKKGWSGFKEVYEKQMRMLQTEPDLRLRWSCIRDSIILQDFDNNDYLKFDENNIAYFD